jgi:hypothetical protein
MKFKSEGKILLILDNHGSHTWRKLHNEELHGLYSSPNIVRAIKARRMRWAGHVARMGGERCIHFDWEA